MNFTELLDEVFIWTKRPDLDAASRSAIRRNTLKYHRREKWFKDLAATTLLNPDPSSPTAIIPITIPRFRQFASIRISGFSKPLSPMVVDDLLDKDGYARSDIFLIAGTNLNIKWGAGFPSIDVVYYQDPIAIEAGYDSWIANEYPDLIACAAAAEVLAFDNESEIYKAAKMTEVEQYHILLSNNLEVEAR